MPRHSDGCARLCPRTNPTTNRTWTAIKKVLSFQAEQDRSSARSRPAEAYLVNSVTHRPAMAYAVCFSAGNEKPNLVAGFVPQRMSPVPCSKRLPQIQRFGLTAASGYRNLASGALSSVGLGGWSWSSSPNSAGSTNAGSLNFNDSRVNPLNNDNRANGLTVRCVRVFTAA